MKYAAFKLAGVALSLSLVWTSAQAAALRVAADPVPHAEILNYIKKNRSQPRSEGGGADQRGQRQ